MATVPWSTQLSTDLAKRKAAGRYRSQRIRESAQGVNIQLEGKSLLSFCSNDYLGLANHPALKQAFIDAVEQQGVGSGAAHLLTGHSRYHQQLEEQLAEFIGHEKVLLFSSGYQANIGVIDGLMSRDDVIIQDKLNHASLLDGARLSMAKQYRYQHADMSALSRRLEQSTATAHKLIVSDGVFSMDGDLAPLPELLNHAKKHDAAVLIDDAHGLGVLGKQGEGLLAHWNIKAEDKPIIMGTFGKAFGTSGAFVAADEVTIETLIQQARSYVYTTAQPAAIAAATLASLKLVQEETWRRDKLQTLISQFRAGAQALGLHLMDSQTAIQPIVIGDDKKAIEIGNTLENKGILVGVIRPPTVAEGSARLRITFSANHSEQHVSQLLDALEFANVH
ncbi:MAG: 8-amino-7-oxononanoate synthase [Gammaproteobacteria bacterium]|nr:MAG: 8-amino-7-oxononanoate synthase [Gammaproteobacteria bacterium]